MKGQRKGYKGTFRKSVAILLIISLLMQFCPDNSGKYRIQAEETKVTSTQDTNSGDVVTEMEETTEENVYDKVLKECLKQADYESKSYQEIASQKITQNTKLEDNLMLSSGTLQVKNNAVLTIEGNLAIAGGKLNVDSGKVIVNGDIWAKEG